MSFAPARGPQEAVPNRGGGGPALPLLSPGPPALQLGNGPFCCRKIHESVLHQRRLRGYGPPAAVTAAA